MEWNAELNDDKLYDVKWKHCIGSCNFLQCKFVTTINGQNEDTQ